LLGKRYRIVSLLGIGGMGEVYRTTDLRLSQQVALKFLPAEAARDAKFLARFKNEVRIARQVSHPNVCRPMFHGPLICSREPPVVGQGRTIAFGVR
jgi:serine/threonine protein kinase